MTSAQTQEPNINFEELWPQFYHIALFLCRHRATAEDVVQEACIKIMKSGDSFRGESTLSTWTTRIIMNALNNYRRTDYRKLDRFVRDVSEEDRKQAFVYASTCAAQYAQIEKEVNASLVEHAVSRLSSAHQVVVRLFYYEELSYQEIAVALDIPLGTVQSRLARALDKLQKDGDIILARYGQANRPENSKAGKQPPREFKAA